MTRIEVVGDDDLVDVGPVALATEEQRHAASVTAAEHALRHAGSWDAAKDDLCHLLDLLGLIPTVDDPSFEEPPMTALTLDAATELAILKAALPGGRRTASVAEVTGRSEPEVAEVLERHGGTRERWQWAIDELEGDVAPRRPVGRVRPPRHELAIVKALSPEELTVLKAFVKGRSDEFIRAAYYVDQAKIDFLRARWGGDPGQLARVIAAREAAAAPPLPPGAPVLPMRSVPAPPVGRPTAVPAPAAVERDVDDQPEAGEIALGGGAYIAVLLAGQLFADPAYQRPLDEARVKRMAKSFDRTLLGVIDVSDRGDDRYAIVDGQHRWGTILERSGPATAIACNVHTGLSLEDEAALFYAIDRGRKALTGWDRWKARRGAGDLVVRELEACVAEYGMSIAPGTKDGVIRSTAALEKIRALGGTALLREVLDIVTASYGNASDGLVAEVLVGVAYVRAYYASDEVSLDRLVTAMQGIVPRQLVARAGALREVHRGELPRLVASILVETYNALPGRKAEPFLSRLPSATKRAPGISPKRRAELDEQRRRRAEARGEATG